MAEHQPAAGAGEAKSKGEASPWGELVRELIRGFVVLRDVFAYALPGAVLLALGLPQVREFAPKTICGVHLCTFPTWALVVISVLASYFAGHALLAAYHLGGNLSEVVHHVYSKTVTKPGATARKKPQGTPMRPQYRLLRILPDSWTRPWWSVSATPSRNLTVESLANRYSSPELFVELDRRSILRDMRQGLAAALILGAILFRWWHLSIELLLVPIGLVIWIAAMSANLYVDHFQEDTIDAAIEAARKSTVDRAGKK